MAIMEQTEFIKKYGRKPLGKHPLGRPKKSSEDNINPKILRPLSLVSSFHYMSLIGIPHSKILTS
jgi:hypothetical protein